VVRRVTGDVGLPELGPYLGRLADPTRRFEDPAVGLDQVRLDLVTELFERAAVARGFLMTGDMEGARSALDRGTWLSLWRTAATTASERTIETIAGRLERAARISRYPRGKLSGLLPSPEDRQVLDAKFEAAGIPLEEHLAKGFPTRSGWWDGIRQAAVALEDSWEALEEEARAELRASGDSIKLIERWRPPLGPWYLALGAAILLATWLGLALGGYLPRPGWLDGLNDWFWSIPWP
jgi:hypothetical protein